RADQALSYLLRLRLATTSAAAFFWRLGRTLYAAVIAAPKVRVRPWVPQPQQRRWPAWMRRECATRCHMLRSRFRASGAGDATLDRSKRPSISPAWARATA